ncbi:hypothetical protein J6590_013572 [Homalodisca vitripennis]|nr:hypothetical protein J6590_013572 [Homalodisca vitripennis]
MEKRAKRRQSSVSVDLMAELTMTEVTLDATNSEQCAENVDQRSGSSSSHTAPPYLQPELLKPSTPPESPTSQQQQTIPTVCVASTPQAMSKELVIGDSLLRHAGGHCCREGAVVEFCPGGKIDDIKSRLLEHVGVEFNLIYIHVGTNNLRRGYNGGPGYNGGQGKREALHSMAGLLYTVRTRFPSANVVLNSILIRGDLSYKALNNFNLQLELMCQNFGVTFVDVNRVLSRWNLARDGVHLNRRETISSVQEEESTSRLDLSPMDGDPPRRSLSSSVSGN